MVVLEGLTSKEAPEVIDGLTERFRQVPKVHFVDSRLPVKFLNNRQLLFATPSELEELERLVEGAIDHARGSLTGFFGASQESYNPSKLQDLSAHYKIFENIKFAGCVR